MALETGSNTAPLLDTIAGSITESHERSAATRDIGVSTEPLITSETVRPDSPPKYPTTADMATSSASCLSPSAEEQKPSNHPCDDSPRDALLARIAALEQRTADLQAQSAELGTHNADLVNRNVELVIRSRALLAANQQLQRRGSACATEDLSGVADEGASSPVPCPRAHERSRADVPAGLMLAKKYRAETPWRRKVLEVIAVWATQNAELRKRNVQLQKRLAKQQAANVQGSKVLAQERDKIRYLQAEKETLRATLAEKDAARAAIAENEAMRIALNQQSYIHSMGELTAAMYSANPFPRGVFTAAPARQQTVYKIVPRESPHVLTSAVSPFQAAAPAPTLLDNQPRFWASKGPGGVSPATQPSGLAPASMCSAASGNSIEIVSVSSRGSTPRPSSARPATRTTVTLPAAPLSPVVPFALLPSGIPPTLS